jgi:DNA (cytosine-5)-methyltransferase 1
MPRLLDVFCGAGGCSVGYARAGFDVVGVDLAPQPRYPFPFLRCDALEFLAGVEPGDYDVIHASPPCQAHSAARTIWPGRVHADFLAATRAELERIGTPWIIENVPGAPMRRDVILCGSMFGLEHRGFQLRRHRWFELSDPRAAPLVAPCWHRLPPAYVYGHGADNKHRARYGQTSVKDWAALMGIDWMTRDELAQAIPPAYTELLGRHLAGILAECR